MLVLQGQGRRTKAKISSHYHPEACSILPSNERLDKCTIDSMGGKQKVGTEIASPRQMKEILEKQFTFDGRVVFATGGPKWGS